METSVQKINALMLGLGSLLFLVAAFLPYSRVFVEPVAEKRLEIMLGMRKMWNIGQLMFGVGSVLTVFALGIQSYGFREIDFARWSYLGILLMAAGAMLWCWHLTERMVSPEAFARNEHTPYIFAIYSVLTQAGLVLFGILILKSDVASWAGWMLITGSAVFFILMVIFRDMPPLVYYILTMVAAVVLFVGAD